MYLHRDIFRQRDHGLSTLDNSDLLVTGPGFSQPQPASYVSSTTASNGSPRTATYSVNAPAGGWLPEGPTQSPCRPTR